MTENDRQGISAEIMKNYGLQVSPNDEFITLYCLIKAAQTQSTNELIAAKNELRKIKNPVILDSTKTAFWNGVGKWGIGSALVGLSCLIYVCSYWYMEFKKSQATTLSAEISTKKEALNRYENLGFLKDINLEQDNRGKYFILKSAPNGQEFKAGVNYMQLDKNTVKIYSEFFK